MEPLGPPKVSHPSRRGWTNLGVEVYREAFGDEDYQKYSRRQFPDPMPAPSLGGRAWLSFLGLSVRAIFGVRALPGRRGTHARGVGARGKLAIVAQPEFPEHDFFTPGRSFDCRLRHANATLCDDAAVVARGCALKFADSDQDSPLDLAMNSGPIPGFWNLNSFVAYGAVRLPSQLTGYWGFQKALMRRLPAALIGTIESQRVAPSSYAEIVYYSKTPLLFRARDGRVRYARYRIMLSDLDRESGLPSPELQKKIWVASRPPEETAPNAYLQQEYKDRLARGKLEYTLQIQLWDWQEDDTAEVFNPYRYWDEEEHP